MRRANLARLVVAVIAVVALALVTNTTDLLIVIVALIVMIMLHELGHFVTAKWSGMKVTEYFLGFGPRLWSFRRGETEYGVKALPLGGYVKIIGMSNLEEVPPEDEPRTYRQQPFRKRLLVAVAGSAVHFILAAAAHLHDPRRLRAAAAGHRAGPGAAHRGREPAEPCPSGRDRARGCDRLDRRSRGAAT